MPSPSGPETPNSNSSYGISHFGDQAYARDKIPYEGQRGPRLPELSNTERLNEKLLLPPEPPEERPSRSTAVSSPSSAEPDAKELFKAIKPELRELRKAAFEELRIATSGGQKPSAISELALSCCLFENDYLKLSSFINRTADGADSNSIKQIVTASGQLIARGIQPILWWLKSVDRVLLQTQARDFLKAGVLGLGAFVGGIAIASGGELVGGLIGGALSVAGSVLALPGGLAFQTSLPGVFMGWRVKSSFNENLKSKLEQDPACRALVADYLKRHRTTSADF